MEKKYVLAVDQSTQGTKAVVVDEDGQIVGRADVRHRQLVNAKGWVSHDPEEIYQNTIQAVKDVMEQKRVKKDEIRAFGISNQRETTVVWKKDGTSIGNAIVWQCARASEIAERFADKAEWIREITGLPLSPYFPAAKMAWLIEHQIPKEEQQDFLLGTMDSWLLYKLTGGQVHKTDYSNASRTQLFNLHTLNWDEELCRLFGVPLKALPQICDSNSNFGVTTLDGYFESPIPIYAVMGDSHASLFAQGCHEKGMTKATYGTGSSIMMNVGEQLQKSSCGLATSLAWGIDGKVSYVLEGNINYTGAVISWLKDEVGLIASIDELEPSLAGANQEDATILVPAFTGLSAPYWDDTARAILYGMSRTTGRAEIIKAAVESIAFQITDVARSMEKDSGIAIRELNVDGGPTRNKYLMQFQSDLANVKVSVPQMEEFSALGVAYLAGIRAGIYKKKILFEKRNRTVYTSSMTEETREHKYRQWQRAVALSQGGGI